MLLKLMADNDTQVGTGEEIDAEMSGEVAEPDFDHLMGIVTDGLIGALGGLVGTAAMSVGLFIAATIGVFDMQSIAALSRTTGLVAILPGNALAIGYLIFLAGGMFIWPLLLASVGSYLPGKNFAMKGIPFGFVLWTGFVGAFASGVPGGTVSIGLYAVITLIAHVFYGFTLGSVYDYLSDRPDTLV